MDQQTDYACRSRTCARDNKFRDPAHVTGSKHEITNLELVNAEGRSGLIIAFDSLARARSLAHA